MVSFGSSEPVRPQRPIPNNLFQRRRFNRQASRVDESDSSDEEEYQGNEVVPRINQEHLSELSPPERTKFLAMVDAKKRMLLAKWAREGKDIPRHDRNELQVTVHHNLGHEFSSPENPDIHKKRSNRSFRNLFGLVSRDMPPVPDMPSRDPVDVSNRDDAASAPSLHQLTGAMSLNGSQDAFDSISGILNGSRRDAGSTLSIDADRPRDRTKTVNESQKLETIEKTHDNPPEISASSMHNLPYQSFSLLRDNTALLALSDQSGTHYFAPRNDDNESSHIKKAQSASAKKESDKRAEIGVSTSESSQDPFCKCNVTLLRKKRGHKSMVSTDNSTRHFDERYHTSPKDPPASNSYPTDDTDTSQAYQGEGLLEAETAFPPVMVLEPVSGCQHLGSGSQIDISRLRPTNEVNAYSDMANTDLTGDRTSSDSFEEILAPYSSTIGEIQRPRYLPLKQDVPKLENHATTKASSHGNQSIPRVGSGLWSDHKGNDLVQIEEPVQQNEEFEMLGMQVDPSKERQHPPFSRARFESTKGNGRGRLEDVSPTRSWKSQARDMGMVLSPGAEQKEFAQTNLGRVPQEEPLHPRSCQGKLPKAHSSPAKKISESMGVGKDWVKSKIRGKKQGAIPQPNPEIVRLEKPQVAKAVTIRRVVPGEVKLIDIKKPKKQPRETSPGQLTNRGLIEKY